MGIFDRLRGEHVRIHVVIKGRIGDAWRDVDEHLRVPVGTTLGKLVEVADAVKRLAGEGAEPQPGSGGESASAYDHH